ncbi:hypothetical protein [Salinicola peritrichatus]|uniref:hypothetical protein n=1 Tax=Salinicola peritrichatus TaxID=1267424 RepID=UPI000DA1F3BD|nr:hypothetical protein [Salinicola peritrichatus]
MYPHSFRLRTASIEDFFQTLQEIAVNTQKVKSQHPAIGWAIDVTQISREGVLGLAVPVIDMSAAVGRRASLDMMAFCPEVIIMGMPPIGRRQTLRRH